MIKDIYEEMFCHFNGYKGNILVIVWNSFKVSTSKIQQNYYIVINFSYTEQNIHDGQEKTMIHDISPELFVTKMQLNTQDTICAATKF